MRADLDALRAGNPAALTDLAGTPAPVGWQLAYIADVLAALGLAGEPITARYVGALTPRQVGKSYTLAVVAAMVMLLKPGAKVLIVSAGEDAARRLADELKRILTAPALAPSVDDEQATLLRLSTGSVARSIPASERQARGWTADLVLADELAYQADSFVQGAVLPTLAATGGVFAFASSAGPALGTFYDLVTAGRAGSEHVRLHEARLTDAPWITGSAEAMLREGMSPLRAAAELDNVFAGAGSLYFPPELVRGAVADVELPGFAGLGAGAARAWCALDPAGSGADHAALAGYVRVPEAGPRVFLLALAHRWPAASTILGPTGYVEEIVAADVPYGRLMVESNGVGQAVAEEVLRRLRERHPTLGGGEVAGRGFRTRAAGVAMTAELKSTLFSHLRLLLDRRSLVIPAAAEDVVRELLLLSVELNPSGTERIEASAGHDDLALAAALALQPWRIAAPAGGRKWTTLIGRHADPSAPVPPLMDDSRGHGEVVATPSGVELPRRPILQSVDGPGVTRPAVEDGAVASSDSTERIGRFVIDRRYRNA